MATDWEARYQADDTPWDKGESAPPLREFLQRERIAGRVLVPGCGAGHDVRLLAQQGAEVTGLDIAPSALQLLESKPKVANETYRLGNFLELDPEFTAQFDWLFEHTCLCAIEPEDRTRYAKSAAAALKPGGQFLAIFYQIVEDYDGSGPPHPIDDAEIEALFGDNFTMKEIWMPTATYESRAGGKEQMRWMVRRD